ncbi:hypothetical protein [Streptomyces sp. NPDC007083]|uniref:hypothetical protein n=1 Tax=Streptomyces sp. NPDC007083 TaxID=3156913 RepID=UPI0033D2FD6E
MTCRRPAATGPVCLLNTRDEAVRTAAPGELLLCSAPEESRDTMEAGAPADQLRIPANSCTWWAA